MKIFSKEDKVDTTDYKTKYEILARDFDGVLRQNQHQVEDLKRNHQFEIAKMEKDFELKARDFEFKLAHQESETVAKLNKENQELATKLAVANEKNTMLDKIVDLNSDVIDVKTLVEQLINKLPEVKINSLAVSTTESKK